MELKLKWRNYAEGTFDTKTAKLVSIGGRAIKHERTADIALVDGMNYVVGTIDLGRTQVEDANKLAAEIVRRFNEFPEDKKL